MCRRGDLSAPRPYQNFSDYSGDWDSFLRCLLAALVQIVVDEFYLQPRRIHAAALDWEAAALVEGRK